MDIEEGINILHSAELIYDELYCEQRLHQIAREISAELVDLFPMVLSIMGGAVVFTGKLLPLLRFPLEFDYIHVSRYQNQLTGNQLSWLKYPIKEKISNRHVLILDDILDEGYTLAGVKDKVLALGAKSCHTAVFANKLLNRDKPIAADFKALDVPDRFVFGYGMDVHGYWRNLPAIYGLKT